MARNDTVLLDGIIDNRIEESLPSKNKGEVFEFLVFEQTLKEYDLSSEEIESGWVDGGHDGGIDGFFIFVNGHLLVNIEDFTWPKKGVDLSVSIITCKHHDTYKQNVLESLISTVNEIFDFRINEECLNGKYNGEILRKRREFLYSYKKVSAKLNSFSIKYIYASRGDSLEVGESILSRATQIKKITNESFAQCDVSFDFIGSKEIIALYRKQPNLSLELPYLDSLSRGERYILIVRLRDYYDFLKNDDNSLRRYLFDSNIRDFMGLNSVNDDIRLTLNNNKSPDFWLLNNGITILSTSAQLIGQSINMEDIQIVNGLQTSESIYRHFSSGGKDIQERAVMVKVIVSKDDDVRDEIIRATNNQTAVEQYSLHATDKAQRDIDDILLRNGFYYDRRKNFYKNQGANFEDIVTPLYVASGYTSLILKKPFLASRMKSKVLRKDGAHSKIFSDQVDINIWPVIAAVMKRTDKFLTVVRHSSGGERFLKKWRHFVSLCAIAIQLGKFDFSAKDLIDLDIDKFADYNLISCWEIVDDYYENQDKNISTAAKIDMFNIIFTISDKYSLTNFQCVERYNAMYDDVSKQLRPYKNAVITEEFIELVKNELPEQPWKHGMRAPILAKLGCKSAELSLAIDKLIERDVIYRQRDGVLYNRNGEIMGFDDSRVTPEVQSLLVKASGKPKS
ncbi:AIPR family protein [Serratia plymuthica]|uniref:AIPR family protein n=1 Tax=Serratia plymuthica TaxID=82996 RepID=UPI0018D6F321|nr:AIPR family protein [Serratia plymuthica]QPS87448.1 AIPR family protein [Serratia plymuthica]